MNKMKKLWWTMFVLCFCCTGASAQKTIDLVGDIIDEFLNVPLTGVKISVLNPEDSTVVVDSANISHVVDRNGKLLQVVFSAPVKAEKRDYLVRATRAGYNEVWQPITIHNPDLIDKVRVPTIKLRKERELALNEVKVTATKVKMYYKGDTLVYDADAFKLPDGSMLDALIRQLPGVTLNDAGEIFVNGRKVDELLLGSRTFFRGNNKVLMENLPYYTVKNLKVYEKQTDKSEVLGYDVEPRRFVMDVNLRPEYSQGYIANVEAAGGTEERWLGRGFLLGFTDRWRYSLLANLNNVNETRHVGEQGHWTPARMPQSMITTRSVATDLDYQSKDKKTSNTFNADFTSTSNRQDMRQRYEQFLEGNTPVSFTESANRSGNRRLNLHNSLSLKKNYYFSMSADFNYANRDGSSHSAFQQWNDTLAADMRTVGMSEGKQINGQVQMDLSFNVGHRKGQQGEQQGYDYWKQNMSFSLHVFHENNQAEQAGRYTTRQYSMPSQELRHNANDYENKNTWGLFSMRYDANNDKRLSVILGNTTYFIAQNTHDYLYHPDTLMLASQLDALSAITDPGNSYRGQFNVVDNSFSITLCTNDTYRISPELPYLIHYSPWRINVDFTVRHDGLDYQRGLIDTLISKNSFFVNPSLSYRYMSENGKRDFRLDINHTRSSVYLYDLINYRDDSAPLVIKLGNPHLKGNASSTLSADYTDRTGRHMQQYHFGAAFNYRHRSVAQSVTYDPVSGVYTYKPMNVSGAYTVGGKADFSRGLDKNNRWTFQTNADATLDHAVDHAMFAGETESHENIVNTLTLHDNTYIQYSKGSFNVRATGDITWRRSEGRMYDFSRLSALDYRYGLSARYTLPRLKTTLSADGTMYSRRGYGSADLNTDDFVLNASLSQPFLKGKLIARIEAFDLLHQLSSTQYSVNAQGRTETWYRSLPHYVMFHLVYHWNRNPKRQ